MTIKKSLLAVATASAVAIAGAGVAAAEDTSENTALSGGVSSTALSAEADSVWGSFAPAEEGADPTFSIIAAVAGGAAFAAAGKVVGDVISVPGNVYGAVKDFQQFVDDFTGDTQAFINSLTK